MKSISTVAFVALLFMTPFLLCAQGIDSEWSEAEQEIWALEERYMTAFKDGDVAGLDAFLHTDFLGWPSYSRDPLARAAALASVAALHESSVIRTVEIRPRAIHLSGRIALVHYLVILETEEGDRGTAETSYRITHTWVEEVRVCRRVFEAASVSGELSRALSHRDIEHDKARRPLWATGL